MPDLCSSPDPSRSGTLCYSEGGSAFEFVPGIGIVGGCAPLDEERGDSLCERGGGTPWDETLLRCERDALLHCTNEPWWSPSRLQFCRGEHE
jgi:hypothetical protein